MNRAEKNKHVSTYSGMKFYIQRIKTPTSITVLLRSISFKDLSLNELDESY